MEQSKMYGIDDGKRKGESVVSLRVKVLKVKLRERESERERERERERVYMCVCVWGGGGGRDRERGGGWRVGVSLHQILLHLSHVGASVSVYHTTAFVRIRSVPSA